MSAGAAVSSEGSTGAGRSATKMAHSHGWPVGVGFWQETSVSHQVELFFYRQLDCPHNMATGFPQVSDPRNKAEVAVTFFIWS